MTITTTTEAEITRIHQTTFDDTNQLDVYVAANRLLRHIDYPWRLSLEVVGETVALFDLQRPASHFGVTCNDPADIFVAWSDLFRSVQFDGVFDMPEPGVLTLTMTDKTNTTKEH